MGEGVINSSLVGAAEVGSGGMNKILIEWVERHRVRRAILGEP